MGGRCKDAPADETLQVAGEAIDLFGVRGVVGDDQDKQFWYTQA